jgi:hypothetical protein
MTHTEKALLIVCIILFVLIIHISMRQDSEQESTQDEPKQKTEEAPLVSKTERMIDSSAAIEINSHFANEDHPISNYTNYLEKTNRFNPHKGGNFFMENEQNDLYKKQGILTMEELIKQKSYVDGQHGRWGLQSLAADDRRQTTAPYVGTTRSLRAVKIRATDTIVPDKISGTMRPIM